MLNGIKLEICCGCVEDGVIASKYPIDRIELNSALELGGCTPSLATLRQLKKQSQVPVCCMVRPRGGNFLYSEYEYAVMLEEAKDLLEAGADGIVFGFLDCHDEIDVERTKAFCDLAHAYGKEAVFHKAFDDLEDQANGLMILKECGVDRVLTSGGSPYPDILGGCEMLAKLRQLGKGEIAILPGGGVRVNNIQEVLRNSTCKQIHMTSKKVVEGKGVCLDEEQLRDLLDKVREL